MLIAYSSSARKKVRYSCWTTSSFSLISMSFLRDLDPGERLGVIAVWLSRVRGGAVVVVVSSLREMRFIGLALLAPAVVEGADTEEADHVLQGFGLRREFLGRAGELLCASGVALRDQANLADRAVNLAHAGGLLSGRC